MDCSMPGFPVHHQPTPTACSHSSPPSRWSNHLTLCHPLLLPSIFPSTRIFSNESVLHIRWPKYWSFSISPSNEYSGLISFKINWFDLLDVQGILKSLLQHHSLKASIRWHSAFFIEEGNGNLLQYSCVENPMDRGAWWAIVHWVTNSRTQLKRLSMQPSLWSISHICTWILEKTITLTRQIVVSKVMSLLFHMLSSFIIAFLPRSKCLLILWPTVTIHSDFGAQENKICHSVHLFPICALKWWDQMPWS